MKQKHVCLCYLVDAVGCVQTCEVPMITIDVDMVACSTISDRAMVAPPHERTLNTIHVRSLASTHNASAPERSRILAITAATPIQAVFQLYLLYALRCCRRNTCSTHTLSYANLVKTLSYYIVLIVLCNHI